jgi:GH24 family phage-related lysozyme (muramidase)
VVKLVNEQKLSQVQSALLKYNKGTINGKKVILPGLTIRREAEANIFYFGVYNPTH